LPEILKISTQYAASEQGLQGHSELAILVRDCIAGSPNAQKTLYDKYSPAAYGIIRRYMGYREQAAQELLNDCFCKIFSKLDQYSFQGAFEGWIRRIVVNTVTDTLRKNVRDEQHKEVHPEDVYVESDAMARLTHKELLKIVESIPDTQRLVFNLFVFESYSHKEIAGLLRINENNSRWHLNDARKRLKEKISLLMR
jgi:RNA polymerase sigma factor (sigma-70 family)